MSKEINEFDKRYLDGFVEKCAAADVDAMTLAKQAGMGGKVMQYLARLLGRNVRGASKNLASTVAKGGAKKTMMSAGKKLTRETAKTRAARKAALPWAGGIALGGGAAGAMGGSGGAVSDDGYDDGQSNIDWDQVMGRA